MGCHNRVPTIKIFLWLQHRYEINVNVSAHKHVKICTLNNQEMFKKNLDTGKKTNFTVIHC